MSKKLWTPGGKPMPSPESGHTQTEEPHLRLLICNPCKSIEELPDYLGSDPDGDVLLAGLLQRHGHRDLQLGGDHADMRLGRVPRRAWENGESRTEIVKRIREQEGHTGLGDEFYATTDTYREEAGKCFNAHRRPKDGCVDYRTPGKLLGNTLVSNEERNELTDDQRRTMREMRQTVGQVYLCDWCPVQSMVNLKRNEARL